MKYNILPALALLLSLISFAANAQTMSADSAYRKAQQARSDADDLWNKKNPTPAEIETSILIYKNTLKFLDSLPVRELSNGNIYLKARRNDVTRDLARVYASTGQKELALETLEKWYLLGNSSELISLITDDSVFMSIKTDPRFLAILNKLKAKGILWKNAAFKTPYKPDLSEEEKVAGLSLLWSQAKDNFVYFDHLNIDWNQTYIDYLPKVRNTRSTAEYYKVLTGFYVQLKDAHTNVYPPKELVAEFYSRPPFRTELIEGRVFVTQVFSDSLLKEGIKPGLEIVKIDGEPVASYAEKNVKPYQSSSTPQDMEVREFTYALLAGSASKPINVECKEQNGKISQRTIARSGYHDVKGMKSLDFQVVDGIGYLAVNDFENQKIPKDFDSLFAEISKTKGLIIDIRYNGGGSGDIGFSIIQKLTNKPFEFSSSRVLQRFSTPGNEPRWEDNKTYPVNPDSKKYYSKPVILLIGPRTFSAAEDFAVAFDYMKRGKMVGMPTGGSTGQPVDFDLPGGGTARVCGKNDYYPDGKQFVGIGIIPDVMVKRTVKDLLNGTDAAKDKAIELLK